ncbi:PREDICTED: solute carrier family 26 member 10-like [Ceratosolen solmsi marchali]|uniref:Solute carrier family 26 member 10-like n=1 Tax=Ceratosolen solmsi marchali TaxID=326594 RepID=A0AAJ6YQT3_9HYME|nr:PREDICTED: solute carrier family 26 member 10-like [Ceratosolen solmsi marchali]
MSAIMSEVVVRRPIYKQDDLNKFGLYSNPKKMLSTKITNYLQKIKPTSYIKDIIPIIRWLPEYHWKHDLFGDLIAGITVAVMHIPQGMAYAILGNVPPIIGIYMAFFPVLVYSIFGTSRHNSMGTFAVICMMVGKVVLSHTSTLHVDINNSTTSIWNSDLFERTSSISQIEIATAVTFMVAIMQLAMYFLRLGIISSLLSEALISGFTTAAAVHVLTSQIKDLFGLKLCKRSGVFKVLLIYYDIFTNIDNVNIIAMIISGVTITIIIFNNKVLKPRLSKRCLFPMPIEMILIIFGTIISIYFKLENVYNIITVGNIPVGFPKPKIPPMELLPSIILDSFVITMVSYTITMSMALTFAQKLNYDVNSNQELIALGLGNLIGSFFSCMPFCSSLSRSLIQQTVGGRTQVASLFSCGILLFVLLWIGPCFEALPRCVLASIIVVALKGMLMQVKDFIRFLRLSDTDATIWMATFLTAIIFDIEYGLLIGALLCLTNLLVLSCRPYVCGLALLPGTEYYLDFRRFKGTERIPGLKIFHYAGGLNFVSRQNFKKDLSKITGVIPYKVLYQGGKINDSHQFVATEKLKILILDFSSLIHIDIAGVETLYEIVDDYIKIDVFVYIAGCSGPVYEIIQKYNILESKQDVLTLFPSINDAVKFAQYKNHIPSVPIWTTTQIPKEENYTSRLLPIDYFTNLKYSNMDSEHNQRIKNKRQEHRRLTYQYGTFIEEHNKICNI